ncbi:MAG: Npt1/Npt2 family nucleotide transporter, partial [Myxococcota bacterium]|nr:Npt1/Npt2 family nucleotide transporter [Myxococcota bacterium]
PAAATPEAPPSPAGEAVPSLRAAWDGAAMVLRSRYLIGILGIVTLYEISSVLADFQFSAFVVDAFPGRAMTDSRTEYLGRFAFFTGLLGIAIQIFATSAIQRRVGVGAALLVLPVAMASGAAAFLALPALWTASLWFGADATLNYGIHQSSKEALYTPTPVDAKYRAKAFIDVFGIRLAKAAGALLIWAMVVVGSDPRLRAVAAVAIVALWIRLVVVAGRRFDRGGMVGGNRPAGTHEPGNPTGVDCGGEPPPGLIAADSAGGPPPPVFRNPVTSDPLVLARRAQLGRDAWRSDPLDRVARTEGRPHVDAAPNPAGVNLSCHSQVF